MSLGLRSAVALLLALHGAVSTARTGEPPPASGHGRQVPFTLRANKVILPVRVGCSRELRIVLDSGMSSEGLLLYRSELRDSIGLKNPMRMNVGGAGAGRPATALVGDSMSFRVGDVLFVGQRVIVLEGDPMKGFPSDGVCGYSLFGRHVVELDYDRMKITLHGTGEYRPESSWITLPLTLKGNRIPWIEVKVSVRGPDRVPLSCYIDLASSEALELLTRDGMKFGLPESLQNVYLGRGLSGDINGQRGKLAWLELGPHRLSNVTAAVVPAAVRSRQPGADAVIGNGLLRRFHCVFDYGAGRLYLKPNSHFAEPD
jgi:hypothetical protein